VETHWEGDVQVGKTKVLHEGHNARKERPINMMNMERDIVAAQRFPVLVAENITSSSLQVLNAFQRGLT
jgi:hypothetical protein